jgi:hypothetical protein
MTRRHFTLFTLRSGQSGLGFYTTQRDAATLRLPGRIATLNSVVLPAISGLLAMPWYPASP